MMKLSSLAMPVQEAVPGDQTLAGISDASRDEILELFPELSTREGVDGYTSARRSLKKHEATLVVK